VRAPAQPARRRGLFLPVLAVLAALTVLIGLGVWQLERKAWKEALIATLEQRLAQPPAPLPDASAWSSLRQDEWEFRRVRFTAQFLPADAALVYTVGSSLRSDVSGPGYWVFAPAAVSGASVAVNRGFVPQGRPEIAQLHGPVDIVGTLRWPEARSWFLQADDPARNMFFVRDPAAIAAARRWGAVAPFYVEQEAPVPPGGWPKPGPLRVNLRNEHLQYAFTWFGLAAVLLVLSAIWLVPAFRSS
jgi:surfeit locus 1 family protein